MLLSIDACESACIGGSDPRTLNPNQDAAGIVRKAREDTKYRNGAGQTADIVHASRIREKVTNQHANRLQIDELRQTRGAHP
ncbi:hypothetical protein [Arthrobacter castelli]|uniref:hypothetical protein n=1 Tax=Arthrobacter castelli TaxID=271431 RepID=UPI00041970F8|nr:hypothetical protein [Arthrobacter castelli]